MTEPAPSPIRIAAAILLRPDGAMLVVRKRGTTAFMQPGGKIDAGEAPGEALRRELREELGLDLQAEPDPVGEAAAPAAHEPGRVVEAALFLVRAGADLRPVARAEIAEVAWIDPRRPDARPLAPLTRDHVLPLARALAEASARI